MKKAIAVILLLLCLICLSGCGETPPEDVRDFLVTENGKQYLVLPISREKVEIREEYTQALANLDLKLLTEAEQAIQSEIPEGSINSGFYLQMDGEHLYLYMEVIEDIVPPNTEITDEGNVISSGCNIDHTHIFLSRQITR